jgi:hypothetical protein
MYITYTASATDAAGASASFSAIGATLSSLLIPLAEATSLRAILTASSTQSAGVGAGISANTYPAILSETAAMVSAILLSTSTDA